MIDFSLYTIPHEPGCYIYKNSEGEILYIGKAKDLKKRVSSYFNGTQTGKTAELVANIAHLETIAVRNEREAWILEARLIRNHRPPFNIQLKDAERLSWIMLSDGQFPRIFVSRNKKDKGKRFGPFTSAQYRNRLMEVIKRVYKIRSCTTMPKRPCLYFDIGMCSAPCIARISSDEYGKNVRDAVRVLNGNVNELIAQYKEGMNNASKNKNYEKAREYRDNYQALEGLLEKQVVETSIPYDQHVIVIDSSRTQIALVVLKIQKGVITQLQPFLYSKQEVGEQFFEDFIIRYYASNPIPQELLLASELPNQSLVLETLSTLKKENQGNSTISITVPQKGTKKELLAIAYKNAQMQLVSEYPALQELQDALSLPTIPHVIECFDISNTGDQFIVGSMVQFRNGKANKSQYRRFKIRTVSYQDDFASIREVVYRRYRRLLDEKKALPDLIVIDGGSPQLRFALQSLEELNVNVPCIGLAKEFESIYVRPDSAPILLDQKSRGLLLLEQVRNEAHRFAISYNRLLRQKEIRRMPLS